MTHLLSSFMLLIGVSILFTTFSNYIKKNQKKQKSIWESFWLKERAASFNTELDFPHELLLTLNKHKIPLPPSYDAQALYNRIISFGDLPMVSLENFTNLELKECYGIKHFNKLIRYEETYMYFLKSINDYIFYLEDGGFVKEKQELTVYYKGLLAQTKKNKN